MIGYALVSSVLIIVVGVGCYRHGARMERAANEVPTGLGHRILHALMEVNEGEDLIAEFERVPDLRAFTMMLYRSSVTTRRPVSESSATAESAAPGL